LGTTGGTGEEALRLDGNSAAGLLAEIFVVEMTSAQITCGQCGGTTPLGSLLMYGGQIGTVLRCPRCDSVQLRIAHVRGQYCMDMQGMALMKVAPSIPA
jgi:hypothetical protein